MIVSKAYINGIFIEKESAENIISPETNKTVGVMPSLDKKDIDKAYNSANEALFSWENLNKNKRIEIMEKWAKLISSKKNDIANIMVLEIAKPLNSAISEITRTVEYIMETIEAYKRMNNIHINVSDSKLADITKKPLGIILAISPFNYPLNLTVTKLCPALLTGNTVVMKSATNGTLSCYEIIKLAHEAGFPAGVLNFVTGKGSKIGDSLIHNKLINAIMFTGGTKTGLNIAKASTLKHLMFEMGGKDPAIVCEDADLDLTSDQIISGAFSYSGQRCTAIKRVFVHSKVKEELKKLLTEKINKLTVGLAIDNSKITALINKNASDHVQRLLDDAIKKGATSLNSQKRIDNLIWPMLLDNITMDMAIVHEEQFGPILPLIEFQETDDVIRMANDSTYGLQASIFTRDINNAKKMALKLNVGSVNINGASQRGPDFLPFVGVKGSGLSTQGIQYALDSVVREFGIITNK